MNNRTPARYREAKESPRKLKRTQYCSPASTPASLRSFQSIILTYPLAAPVRNLDNIMLGGPVETSQAKAPRIATQTS